MKALANRLKNPSRISIPSSIRLSHLTPASSSRYQAPAAQHFISSPPYRLPLLSKMPPRKRSHSNAKDSGPATAPRRSSRRVSTKAEEEAPAAVESPKPAKKAKTAGPKEKPVKKESAKKEPAKKPAAKEAKESSTGSRAMSPDPPISSIPRTNPDAPRHDGEWYWLMKAEPETRIENGVDVRFSIDDLRSKTEPEGWDGIRAYAGASYHPSSLIIRI